MLKFRVYLFVATILVVPTFFMPAPAKALTMSEIMGIGQEALGSASSREARAYIVVDKQSGRILLSKNADLKWPPASLTKLVTAMVFLDSQTPLTSVITMKKEDEVGGQRLPTKAGIKYRARDLLHAALIASDNNAAHALARGAGLTGDEFVALMNKKAKSLGANNTQFFESTGMNPQNYTTALDFAKIVDEAFKQPYLSLVAKKAEYNFTSVNSKRYTHTVKTTNKLLADSDIAIVGGKTGYLEESLYNFASVTKDRLGNEYVIVVLGAPNPAEQFGQAKQLALNAMAIKIFGGNSAVLGESTTTVTSTLTTLIHN